MAKSEYAKRRLAEIAAVQDQRLRRSPRPKPEQPRREPSEFMPKAGATFMKPQYCRVIRVGSPDVVIHMRGFVKWRRPARVIPKDQLRGIGLRATGCGVYFLWSGPELVYVGQSLSVPSRLIQHGRARDGLGAGKRMSFTHATSIPVPGELLDEIEYEYICTYGPPFNDKWSA